MLQIGIQNYLIITDIVTLLNKGYGKMQTTLRVVENLGGRVFSTTGSFYTIGSAQN